MSFPAGTRDVVFEESTHAIGGWYSYRASKASVYQLAKTFDLYLRGRCDIHLLHPDKPNYYSKMIHSLRVGNEYNAAVGEFVVGVSPRRSSLINYQANGKSPHHASCLKQDLPENSAQTHASNMNQNNRPPHISKTLSGRTKADPSSHLYECYWIALTR